ncbi:MAG: hypothetical protein Q8J74_02130 [Candidatus Didemnitutus sp.]|nr:hypothetical protein [Candidatus Didemnitutus sp.]
MAFSLVEVVIAVGIFALAVTVTLSLLPALVGKSASSADAFTVQRMPDGLRAEMQRLAAVGGFDSLAGRVPVMSAPLEGGLPFVASGDGLNLQALSYLPPGPEVVLPETEQFFLIEIWRFATAPLAYDASGAVLPVYVRVSWPYRVPGSAAPTLLRDRNQLTFAASITR